MELSPSTLNRLANSGLGVIPAVVGVAYATQASGGSPRLLAWAAVIGLVFIAVRGYRLGVTCDNSKARTTRTGRKRWTPITAFVTSPSETAGSRLSKERIIAKLRRWAGH